MFTRLIQQQRPLFINQLRLFSSKQIFVSNLPKYWDQNEIAKRFGIIGQVQQVNLIKNSLGQNSGKVIIKYSSEQQAKDAILKFDNNAVENLVCSAKPYQEKGQSSDRSAPSLLSRRVYLMNLPYDAHVKEIQALCQEFAPVDKVVVPRDQNGLAAGYAFVYLQNASDVKSLIEFVDGRHIRSRQIRAKTSLGGEAMQKELNNLKPNDAEMLARYQNYAKNTLNQKMNGLEEDDKEKGEVSLEESESYLTAALARQVKRMKKEKKLSDEDAIKYLIQNNQLKSKSINSSYVSDLENFILATNTAREDKFKEDESLQQMYPKTYMLSQMTQMLNQKKGMSDFEIYGEASEIFGVETSQQIKDKKQRFIQPRIYDLNDL